MKQSPFFRICALLLCAALCLVWTPGKAEDCFVIDVDALDMDSLRSSDYVASHLSTQASGIRVRKYISESVELMARVRLTITQMDTNMLLFDKNYGYQSASFDSGEIYLPYSDSATTPYLLTLYVEDWVYAIPFMRLMPRLSHNGASSYGVRISDYDPSLATNWFMGTMLDLDALRGQGYASVPLCASNSYIVGSAQLSLQGDLLTVSLTFTPSANVELHHCNIYLIPQVSELTTLEPPYITQRSYAPGEGIHIAGASSALLYLPMSISYDPTGLPGFSYNLENGDLTRQLALWNENRFQLSVPPTYGEFPSATPEFPSFMGEYPQEEYEHPWDEPPAWPEFSSPEAADPWSQFPSIESPSGSPYGDWSSWQESSNSLESNGPWDAAYEPEQWGFTENNNVQPFPFSIP